MSTVNKAFGAAMFCTAIMGSVALVAVGALAAEPPGPELSGNYTVNGTVFCQPGTTGAKSGAYDVTVGLVTFYPTVGDVALRQTQVLGSVVDTTLPFSVLNKTYDYTYSNTATTVTLNNTPYNVIYSEVEGGIAGAVSGVAVDSNGCARSFTMHLAA
jgi:hypothetical protein